MTHEKQLLAKLLIAPELTLTIENFDANCFNSGTNREIYTTLCDMYMDNKGMGATDVGIKTGHMGEVAEIMTHYSDCSVQTLCDSVKNGTRSSRIETLATILKEKIVCGQSPVSVAEEGMSSLMQIIGYTDSKVVCMYDAYRDFYNTVTTGQHKNKMLKTGISILDLFTGGIPKSLLTVLGARPSVGKSAFVLNLAANIAMQGIHTLVCTLEDIAYYVHSRISSRFAMINYNKFSHGIDLNIDEMRRLNDFANNHKTMMEHLHIDDSTGQNANSIRRKAEVMLSKGKLGCVIVDHLQEMTAFDKALASTSTNATVLRDGAKDQDVPYLLLSQLSRACETENREPISKDLRDSGVIEQAARNIWLMHRPNNAFIEENPEYENKLKLIVSKSSHGKTGSIWLEKDMKYMWVGDPEDREVA